MATSVVALSLIGLGAVQALPASNTVNGRQILGFPGGSGGSFTWGSGPSLPTCVTNIPIAQQSPCVFFPITGGINPPKEKRQEGATLGSTTSPSEEQAAIAALELQLLQLQNKPNPSDDDLAQIAALQAMIQYTEGISSISAPPGVGSTLTHGRMKKRFTLPPDYNSDTKHAIEELELDLETLQNKHDKTDDDYAEIADIKAALNYLVGITSISAPPGAGSTFTPGKAKRFTLPPDYNSNTKHAIEELELELETLQNKHDKTDDDYAEIADIKAALNYLVGITSISAPPGAGSTFTPGKAKRFTLPPDYNSDTKHAIEELELELEQVQNKPDKTDDDYAEIADIKAALNYLVGITSISAPPGSGTTFTPGKAKRFTLPPDANSNPKHAIEELEKALEDLENKRHKTEEDRDEIENIKAALRYLAGIVNISAPPGTTTTLTPGKKTKRFTLPPDANSDPKHAIEELEKELEDLQNKQHKTREDREEIDDIKAALNYLVGIVNISAPPGTTTTFTPGKKAKRFILPPDANSNPKHAIEELEKELEDLQNKQYKTREDREEIEDIKAALNYLVGIVNISAPPGTTTTFTPGKKAKRFTLPPDATSDVKKAIAELEKELEDLEHKKHKSDEDRQEIRDIKDALKYLAGIENISAPDGSTTTFTPGKRQELASVGSYSAECPNVAGAELALESLLHLSDPSVEEYVAIQKLKHFLNGCGITIVQSPDGTTTIIQPSTKRDTSPFNLPADTTPGFDLAGLERAYEVLLQSLGTSKPSFTTWLALQHLADLLSLYGVSIDRSPAGTTTTITPSTKRQSAPGSGTTITIGSQACQLADILGLKGALAALETAYGDPSHAPQNVFLAEQVIVSALQLCGQTVGGWTTLTPGNPIPGGPIKPSTRRARDAPVSDPSALLAALQVLEDKYGSYGSGTIPVPVFLVMEGMVTILQEVPGVTVPGWPILGQGSVTLTPST